MADIAAFIINISKKEHDAIQYNIFSLKQQKAGCKSTHSEHHKIPGAISSPASIS